MGAMNRNMNLPQIQHIMMEFEKESEIMDMKEEMMSDTIDEAMEEEEDEEEQDAIVNQVLDEIGINLDESVRTCSNGTLNLLLFIYEVLTVPFCLLFSLPMLLERPSNHQQERSASRKQRACRPTMPRFKPAWTIFDESRPSRSLCNTQPLID